MNEVTPETISLEEEKPREAKIATLVMASRRKTVIILAFLAIVLVWRNRRLTPEYQTLPRSTNLTGNVSCREDKRIHLHLRIPKTGSETLRVLIEDHLAHRLGFGTEHYDFVTGQIGNQFFDKDKRANLMRQFLSSACPLVISGHMRFLPFHEVNHSPSPTYTTFVRHPIDKTRSNFYFKRRQHELTRGKMAAELGGFDTKEFREWENFDFDEYVLTTQNYKPGVDTMGYFCGYKTDCNIDLAKRNIEQWFSVVGVLEEWDKSMEVFENKLPQYFGGARQLYYSEMQGERIHYTGSSKMEMDERVRKILTEGLAIHIELYEYLKNRVLKQHKELVA